MNKISRITLIAGLIAIIIISLYSLLMNSGDTEYEEQILAQRTEKDMYFANDDNSPFVLTATPFQKLQYYAPDRKYKVRATVIKAIQTEKITLITNTGENQVYKVYGSAVFDIDKKTCLLRLLYQEGRPNLFLPFMDKTSGNETYGSGRYLDVDFPVDDELTIDFNMAYNPYCAYTSTYSCPFPPKSNILDVAIQAGEKTFGK